MEKILNKVRLVPTTFKTKEHLQSITQEYGGLHVFQDDPNIFHLPDCASCFFGVKWSFKRLQTFSNLKDKYKIQQESFSCYACMQPCQLQPLPRTLSFSREPRNRNDVNDTITALTTHHCLVTEGETFGAIEIKLSINVYRNSVLDSSLVLAYSPK